MEFEIVQFLPGEPGQVFEILQTPEFRAEAAARTGTERKLLSERTEEDGSRHERWQMIDRAQERPAFAARFLGPVLKYEFRQSTWPEQRRVAWKVIPAVGQDRIRAEGEERIEGGTSGVERRVEGLVEVKIPVVGPKLAAYIGGEVEKGFRDALDFIASYVAAAIRV